MFVFQPMTVLLGKVTSATGSLPNQTRLFSNYISAISASITCAFSRHVEG